MIKKSDILFYLIFAGLIVFYIFLIFNQNLLPFIDLPNHLAEATIFRYYGEAGNEFSKYFSIDKILVPNTFNLFFFSFKLFPTVEIASKFFYAIYILLLPFSVFLLIKKSEGDKWFSLITFIYLLNYNVIWGFSGFSFGIPMFFIALYLLILKNEKQKVYIDILLILISLFLFTIHAQIAGMYVLIIFIYALLAVKLKSACFIRNIYIAIPLLLIMVVWWLMGDHQTQGSTSGFAINYYKNLYIQLIHRRISVVWLDNFWLIPGFWGKILGSVFSSLVLIPFVYLIMTKYKEIFSDISNRKYIVLLSFLIPVVLIILILPPDIPGQWILFQRFGVFLMIGLIIFISRHFRIVSWYKFTIIGFVFINAFLWSDYFSGFDKVNAGFGSDFLPKNKNAILAGLIYDSDYRQKIKYLHFPSYQIILNKGIATTSLIDYRFSIIKRKSKQDVLPFYDALMDSINNARERYTIADFLLVRWTKPEENQIFIDFHLIRKTGNWFLYESNKKTSTSK